MSKKELFTLAIMARKLGVKSRWLREQTEQGIVPGLPAGNTILYNPDAVNAALAELAAKPHQRPSKSILGGDL